MNTRIAVMAKRKPKPKVESKAVYLATTEVSRMLREYAVLLRKHADYLDKLAGAVDELEPNGLNVLTGNFFFAMEKIRDFFDNQVIKKLAASSTKGGRIDHRVLGELYIDLHKLGGEVDSAPRNDKTQ